MDKETQKALEGMAKAIVNLEDTVKNSLADFWGKVKEQNEQMSQAIAQSSADFLKAELSDAKRQGAEEFVRAFENHSFKDREHLVSRIMRTLVNAGVIPPKSELAASSAQASEETEIIERPPDSEESLAGALIIDVIDHPEEGYFPWIEEGKFARVIVGGEE